jgi:thiamine-phosphate pyrophosphorylase
MNPSPLKNSGLFYAILDSGYVSADNWVPMAEALIAGGAHIIQVRAKKQNSAQRQDLVESILPLTEAAKIPLIVNDDLDLASQLPGVGLHIGQDDISPALAWDTLGPDRIIGWSTHSPEQARSAIRQAALLSYFAVGPVFATMTKPDYTPVGLELVEYVAGLEPPIPFFCIGGITRNNIGQVLQAGARNIVIVSDILQAADPQAAVREVINSLS